MQMKINEKILSIPPYISTGWSNITSLHVKNEVLSVLLHDNTLIEIPRLNSETLDQIFIHHASFMEKVSQKMPFSDPAVAFASGDVSETLNRTNPIFQWGIGSPDGLTNPMQHNPAHAASPDLPPEILQKISSIFKILHPTDTDLPKAVSNCNCFHCQIAKTINPHPALEQEKEEPIADTDLHFQQWHISQVGDKLFSLVNKLDIHETYSVYLGDPIGCTCGRQGCEHIITVLKS